jgi:hypothetical protein
MADAIEAQEKHRRAAAAPAINGLLQEEEDSDEDALLLGTEPDVIEDHQSGECLLLTLVCYLKHWFTRGTAHKRRM